MITHHITLLPHPHSQKKRERETHPEVPLLQFLKLMYSVRVVPDLHDLHAYIVRVVFAFLQLSPSFLEGVHRLVVLHESPSQLGHGRRAVSGEWVYLPGTPSVSKIMSNGLIFLYSAGSVSIVELSLSIMVFRILSRHLAVGVLCHSVVVDVKHWDYLNGSCVGWYVLGGLASSNICKILLEDCCKHALKHEVGGRGEEEPTRTLTGLYTVL